jgi:hypothetical protein
MTRRVRIRLSPRDQSEREEILGELVRQLRGEGEEYEFEVGSPPEAPPHTVVNEELETRALETATRALDESAEDAETCPPEGDDIGARNLDLRRRFQTLLQKGIDIVVVKNPHLGTAAQKVSYEGVKAAAKWAWKELTGSEDSPPS